MRTRGIVELLLVEDNPGDARLLEEVLKEEGIAARLRVVRDGIEALNALRAPGARLPDLILLDLNLPRKNGREFLSDMKTDEALRRIPVVVLTGSMAEEDVVRAYELYANCYITKPATLDGFAAAVRGSPRSGSASRGSPAGGRVGNDAAPEDPARRGQPPAGPACQGVHRRCARCRMGRPALHGPGPPQARGDRRRAARSLAPGQLGSRHAQAGRGGAAGSSRSGLLRGDREQVAAEALRSGAAAVLFKDGRYEETIVKAVRAALSRRRGSGETGEAPVRQVPPRR